MTKRRRNRVNRFTLDEAQTATLIATEGSVFCHKKNKRYIEIKIAMCDREALEPAQRTFGTTIYPSRRTATQCPPKQFPPDGKGIWEIRLTGKKAKRVMKRLEPLTTKHLTEKWRKLLKRCP